MRIVEVMMVMGWLILLVRNIRGATRVDELLQGRGGGLVERVPYFQQIRHYTIRLLRRRLINACFFFLHDCSSEFQLGIFDLDTNFWD